MSNTGIIISKPGVDAKTADEKDLVWSSNFKTFKIYKILKFTSEQTVSHGLNYPPTYVVYRPDFIYDYITGLPGPAGQARVDDTNVFSTGTSAEPTYVILFIDPLNE